MKPWRCGEVRAVDLAIVNGRPCVHHIFILHHALQIGVEDPISDATLLTAITAPALRGDVLLEVADTSMLRQGQ